MTAPLNSQDLIKQPRPSTMDKGSAAQKNINGSSQNVQNQVVEQRKYNRPYVGVVSPANISKTPLLDTLVIKKQENPFIKYKFIPKIKTKSKFQTFASLGVIITGICAFASACLKKN